MCVLTMDEYIEKYLRGTTVYKLPAEVSTINITNIMKFQSLNLHFDKLNLIYGLHGTGKTSIVMSVAVMFNQVPNVRTMLNNWQDEGKIILDIVQEQKRGLFIQRNQAPYSFTKNDVKCILLDDAGCYLDDNGFSCFLNHARTWDKQIIVTTPRREFEYIPSGYQKIELIQRED